MIYANDWNLHCKKFSYSPDCKKAGMLCRAIKCNNLLKKAYTQLKTVQRQCICCTTYTSMYFVNIITNNNIYWNIPQVNKFIVNNTMI